MADWRLREGSPADVPAAMELIRLSPWLTCHTEHTYWILFNHGRRYVVVAETPEGETIGFSSGLRSTRDPELLFVWQLVVAPAYRGGHLAWELLTTLIDDVAGADGCTYVEAAMDAENEPLMRSLQGWVENTDRAWGPRERITYETPDPDGTHRTVSEVIFVFRRRGDPLAAELGSGPEDWNLEGLPEGDGSA